MIKAKSFADNPLVLSRAALSDRWVPKVRRVTFETLGSQVLEAAERVEEGYANPVTDAMAQRWEDELTAAARPYYFGMTVAGLELASKEIDEKTAERLESIGKQEIGTNVEDEFLQLPHPEDVDTYLAETSRLETATSRKKIDAIFQRALTFYDEDLKRGLTPREIAKILEQEGLALTKGRAELIARTSTIWCYNEGAQQEYGELGVNSETWLVTEDDVLCDFCRAMDGKTVPLNEPYWAGGSSMEIIVDESSRKLEFPFDIQHPPLHPYCRCVVIPNI